MLITCWPCFVGSDENADSCAARNYHAEMIKHSADSTLVLIPPGAERCYCLGNPGVDDGPVLQYTSTIKSAVGILKKT